MKALRIILGIIMVLGAASILTMPLMSSVALCWIISIIMLASGIISIIHFIEAKNAEKVAKKNGQAYLKTSVGNLIFGIAAVVISVLASSSVIGSALFMKLIATLFGLWIMLDGVSLIVLSTDLKKIAAPGWVAMMILGILLAIAGISCIVDGFASLVAIGTLFGISMMMSGMALIFS